jgi:protein-tyrosine phosphatase
MSLAEPAQEIVPNLFLGNYDIATSVSWLLKNRITHVLSIMDEEQRIERLKRLLKLTVADHKVIVMDDKYKSPLRLHFDECSTWIRNALTFDRKQKRQGRILIHCLYGISRSPTIVAAYLIQEYGMNASQSIKLIQEKRKVEPSDAFQLQLVRYARLKLPETKKKITEANWGNIGHLWEVVLEFVLDQNE